MSYKRTEAQRLITKYGIPEASSMLSNKENNDCVVRAVSHGFDVDYIQAHHFCEMKLHRKSGKGTYTARYLPKIKQAFGKKIKQLGKLGKFNDRYLTRDQKSKVKRYSHAKDKWVIKRVIKQVPYKVNEFVKAHSEGHYLIVVNGHMFALIDGKIKGNWDDNQRLTRKVKSAYKIN